MFTLCSNISSPKSSEELAIKLIKMPWCDQPHGDVSATRGSTKTGRSILLWSFVDELVFRGHWCSNSFACLTFVPSPHDTYMVQEASRDKRDIIIVWDWMDPGPTHMNSLSLSQHQTQNWPWHHTCPRMWHRDKLWQVQITRIISYITIWRTTLPMHGLLFVKAQPPLVIL